VDAVEVGRLTEREIEALRGVDLGVSEGAGSLAAYGVVLLAPFTLRAAE
jgi:hypothetical protein